MTYIIIGKKQIQIEIRFKMRFKKEFPILVTLILIRIQHEIFSLFQLFHYLFQCIQGQQIVVIHKTDIITGRSPEGCVGIGLDPLILSHLKIF